MRGYGVRLHKAEDANAIGGCYDYLVFGQRLAHEA